MSPLHQAEMIALQPRGVHRIEDGQGLEVSCLSGQAWITQSRDARDVILEAGDAFVLDRPGLALVFAFGAATIAVGAPAHGQIAAAA